MTNGFGAEVARTLAMHSMARCLFSSGRKDIPIGFSRILERATLPYEADVQVALDALLQY